MKEVAEESERSLRFLLGNLIHDSSGWVVLLCTVIAGILALGFSLAIVSRFPSTRQLQLGGFPRLSRRAEDAAFFICGGVAAITSYLLRTNISPFTDPEGVLGESLFLVGASGAAAGWMLGRIQSTSGRSYVAMRALSGLVGLGFGCLYATELAFSISTIDQNGIALQGVIEFAAPAASAYVWSLLCAIGIWSFRAGRYADELRELKSDLKSGAIDPKAVRQRRRDVIRRGDLGE